MIGICLEELCKQRARFAHLACAMAAVGAVNDLVRACIKGSKLDSSRTYVDSYEERSHAIILSCDSLRRLTVAIL